MRATQPGNDPRARTGRAADGGDGVGRVHRSGSETLARLSFRLTLDLLGPLLQLGELAGEPAARARLLRGQSGAAASAQRVIAAAALAGPRGLGVDDHL